MSENGARNGETELENWQVQKDKNNGHLWELKTVPVESNLVNLLLIILKPDKGSVVSPAVGIDCTSVEAVRIYVCVSLNLRVFLKGQSFKAFHCIHKYAIHKRLGGHK